jgi:hypothetical protein
MRWVLINSQRQTGIVGSVIPGGARSRCDFRSGIRTAPPELGGQKRKRRGPSPRLLSLSTSIIAFLLPLTCHLPPTAKPLLSQHLAELFTPVGLDKLPRQNPTSVIPSAARDLLLKVPPPCRKGGRPGALSQEKPRPPRLGLSQGTTPKRLVWRPRRESSPPVRRPQRRKSPAASLLPAQSRRRCS